MLVACGASAHGTNHALILWIGQYADPGELGSVATRAWAACLMESRQAGSRQNTTLTGAALQSCAQQWLQRITPHRQTITLVGDAQLPLSLPSQN